MKLSDKNGGTLGRFVVGSTGTKRIRWSRHCCDEAIVAVICLRRSSLVLLTVSRRVDVYLESSMFLDVESSRLAGRGKELPGGKRGSSR